MKSKNYTSNITSIVAVIIIMVALYSMVRVFYSVEVGNNILMKNVYGVDYLRFFNPALNSENPYSVEGFYNPFWIFPFILVAELFGKYKVAVWIVLNICCYLYVYLKLRIPLWAIIPLLFFSGAIMSAYVGNIEGIISLGLIIPPPIGILLLMIKPQVGTAIVTYYILSTILDKGWKKAIVYLIPLTILFLVSTLLYGTWFLNTSNVVIANYNTISFFPYGIPLGIALIVAGVSRKNIGYALVAIPLTTPYMIFHTWSFPILGAILIMIYEMKNISHDVKQGT
jgi:hypothetical protein